MDVLIKAFFEALTKSTLAFLEKPQVSFGLAAALLIPCFVWFWLKLPITLYFDTAVAIGSGLFILTLVFYFCKFCKFCFCFIKQITKCFSNKRKNRKNRLANNKKLLNLPIGDKIIFLVVFYAQKSNLGIEVCSVGGGRWRACELRDYDLVTTDEAYRLSLSWQPDAKVIEKIRQECLNDRYYNHYIDRIDNAMSADNISSRKKGLENILDYSNFD